MKFLIVALALMAMFSTASEEDYFAEDEAPTVGIGKHTRSRASKTLNTPTRLDNNIWHMKFLLGSGFNFNNEEIQDHRIYDHISSTYLSNPTRSQKAEGKFAMSRAEYADQMEIGGSMSVTYGTISGEGSLSYNEQTSSQEQHVFYWQDYVQQCGCISLDETVMSEALAKDLQDDDMNTDLEALRKKYGDFWIANVCYGSTFKLEFTFSMSSSSKATELAGSLKGEIGIGALTIAAEVNGAGSDENSESSTSSKMNSEVNGFDVPCGLTNPQTYEQAEELQECIGQIVAELNQSCEQFKGGAGLSLEQVLHYKKGLFPISVRVEPIANIDPFDFPADKYQTMSRHIKDAWESVRFLNDYVDTIEHMMSSFTKGVIHQLTDIDTNVADWKIFKAYNDNYSEIYESASKYLSDLLEYVGGTTVDFDYFYEHNPREIFDSSHKANLELKGKMIDGVHEQEYHNSIFRGIFVTMDGGDPTPFFGSLSYNAGEEVVSKVMLNDDGVIAYSALCAGGVHCFLVKKDGAGDAFDLDILREGDICVQQDGAQNVIAKISPWATNVLLDNNRIYEGIKCKKVTTVEVGVGAVDATEEVAVGNSIKILRTPTQIENNIWQMTFLLGSGFSFNSEEIQNHRVYDHRKSTYIIEEQKSQAASGKFASSVAEYSSQLELGGKLSVSYGPISGSGSMSYNAKTSSQQQHIFYWQEYTQMCGCINFQQKVMNQQLQEDIKNNMALDALRAKYGDYYIDNVCYGSTFKLEFTFTSSSTSESESLGGELEGTVGVAGLEVTATVNAKYGESNSESSTSSKVHHEANGIKVPCAISNPIEGSDYDAEALQACVQQVADKLSESCVDFESHTDQSLDDVLAMKKGLFPISVQVVPISDIEPFDFPFEKYQVMKKHIDSAWDAVRFLNDFISTIEHMMNTFSKLVIHEVMDITSSIRDWNIYKQYEKQYTELYAMASEFLSAMTEYVDQAAVSFDDFYNVNPDTIFSAKDRLYLESKGKMIDGVHEKYYGTSVFRGIFVTINNEASPFFGTLTYANDVVSKVMINDDGIIAYASLCGTGVNNQPLHNCFLVEKKNDAIDRFDLDILVEEDRCFQADNNRKNKIAKIDNWAVDVLLDNRLRYRGYKCRKVDEEETSVGFINFNLAEVAVGNTMQIIKTQTSVPDGPYQNVIPLGYGFNFNTQERMDPRIFGRNATFIIEEHSSQTGTGKFASTISEYSQQLEVGGKLSVGFGPISGEGSLSYNEETTTQQQNVFYWQEYTQTCGCISFDNKWLDQSLYDDIFEKQKNIGELRKKYGDYFVSNVCYGATFKVEFTFTSQSQTTITDLEGKLRGELGIGPLSISAEINFAHHESNSAASSSSTMNTESNGFDLPGCRLENPQKPEDAAELQNCINEVVESLSNACDGLESGTGYTLNDVLYQKGTLFATAVTVMPISDVPPFNFPDEKYATMKRHVDLAWEGIGFLTDFSTSLETMMDQFTNKVIHQISDIDFNILNWNVYKKYQTRYHNLYDKAAEYLHCLQEYVDETDLEIFYEVNPSTKCFPMEKKIELESEGKLIDGVHEKAFGTAIFRGIFVEMDGKAQPFYGSLIFAFDIVSKVMLNDDGVIAYASLCGCGENELALHNCFLVGKGVGQTMIDDFDLDILKEGDLCIKEDGGRSKIKKIDAWSEYVHLEDGTLYPGTSCIHDGCPSGYLQKGTMNTNNQISSSHQIGDVITSETHPELVQIRGCSELCNLNADCNSIMYDSYEQTCVLGTSKNTDGDLGNNNRFCMLDGMRCKAHTCSAGSLPKKGGEGFVCGGAECHHFECCDNTNTCESMQCRPNFQRKTTPAAKDITCLNKVCAHHECCEYCGDVDTKICKEINELYLYFCYGPHYTHSDDNDWFGKLKGDCNYCSRWDEFKEDVKEAYEFTIDDFPEQCANTCGRCLPEDKKCYDTDILINGEGGDSDGYMCADLYYAPKRCSALNPWTPTTAPDTDCCGCGGGRIGPKCPASHPYWGFEQKYWKSYVCWNEIKGSVASCDCSAFCIRERHVPLDRHESYYLERCPNSICSDEPKIDFDCSSMTASIHNAKTGYKYGTNIRGYLDATGLKCIFEANGAGHKKLIAIRPELCEATVLGYLDLGSTQHEVDCWKDKHARCWHQDESIALSDLTGCGNSYYKTMVGEYCPSEGDITTGAQCAEAAKALGVTYGGAYTGTGDWQYCLYAADDRNIIYFNDEGDSASPTPTASQYTSVCIAQPPKMCMNSLCTSCEYGGQERKKASGDWSLDRCKEECLKDSGCVAIDYGKGNASGYCYFNYDKNGEVNENNPKYDIWKKGGCEDSGACMNRLCLSCEYGGREVKKGSGDWTLEHCKEECLKDPYCLAIDYGKNSAAGYCYFNYEQDGKINKNNKNYDIWIKGGCNYCPDACYKCTGHRDEQMLCTQWCSTSNYCGSTEAYRFLDCTHCVATDTYDMDEEFYVAATEDTTSGISYVQIFIFSALAFGVGYGFSKYSTKKSKYAPLVADNI